MPADRADGGRRTTTRPASVFAVLPEWPRGSFFKRLQIGASWRRRRQADHDQRQQGNAQRRIDGGPLYVQNVPGHRDDGSQNDRADGARLIGPLPKEYRHHRGRHGRAVNRVGVERGFQHRFEIGGLQQRECAQGDDQGARYEQGAPLAGLRIDEALVYVVNQVAGGREQVIVGGRNHLGEDAAQQDGAHQLRQAHARRQRDDLPRVVRVERGAADDCDGDDDSLEYESAADPSKDGQARVALRAGREELLIHALIAEQQQQGGQQISEAGHPAERPEHGEVIGGQCSVDGRPAACARQQYRQRDERDDGDQQADDEIQVGDGGHTRQRREGDHEGGDDVHAGLLIERGEDEVQDDAAALELVAGDDRVRNDDGDGGQHARGGVVARLQQIGHGELREAPRTSGDDGDQDQSDPAASRHPQRREAVLVSVLGAGEEAARADPGGEQGEDQHRPSELAAGHQEIGLVLDGERAHHRGAQQDRYD